MQTGDVVVTVLKSIKKKILVFAVLATLIPSLGLGLLSFWQNESSINGNVRSQLRTLAIYANHEVEQWINERVHDVRALSTADVLIDGLAPANELGGRTADVHIQEMQRYLRSVQAKLDPVLELTVSDATGHVLASSQALAESRVPANWPPSGATDGVLIATPHWDATRGRPTIAITVPILSSANEILGALSAIFDLRAVQPRLQSLTRSLPGEVVLEQADGAPLLSTRSLAPGLVALSATTRQQLRAHPGEPLNFRGHLQRRVLGVSALSRTLPINIIAERDLEDIYQAWSSFRNWFVSLVTGLTLLVGAIAWRIGRAIVKPLNRLTGAADRIASGDLTVQVAETNNDELGHLTRVFNQMADNLRRSQAEVEAASKALRQKNQLLEALSLTDSLTGLYNRKKLDDVLTNQVARFQRNQRPFAVLMLDIDYFKALNDTYGHLAGDEVLVSVAKLLMQAIRNVDYAARYGGEEFAIVLVETPLGAAIETAERIRSLLQKTVYRVGERNVSVTVSVGVAESRAEDASGESVLARADSALYEAKHAGRNRVYSAA